MKYKLKRSHIIVLVVVLVSLISFIAMPLILGDGVKSDPHAGHNHGSSNTHTNSGNNHNHADAAHNKSAKDSYEVKKLENGSYTYRVISRSGHSYTTKNTFLTQPTVTAVSNDVIKVSGQYHESNNLSGWAAYYNVVGEGKATLTFDYVLASTNNKVAYLVGDQGKFYVTVCNPFHTEQATHTELPGLTISKTGNPEIDYKITETGDLSVSYTVGKIKQVIIVNLK